MGFGVKLNLCFILSAAVIGLPLHSMKMLRIRHLITKYKIDSHLFTARDLQTFLVFSQHPAGVYCAGKPLKSVVYCLIIKCLTNCGRCD